MPSQPSGNGAGRIMSRLALMVVALTLVSQSSASGRRVSHRIRDAYVAKVGEFPFIVSLQYRDSRGAFHHFCAGTILDERNILTADHCARSRDEIFVMVGCHKLNDCKSAHKVARKVVHKYANLLWSALYEIAVLKLAEPIRGLKSWPPPIDQAPAVPRRCRQYSVAGWNKTDDTSPGSPVLKKVGVAMMDWDKCKKDLSTISFGEEFCAGSVYSDSCVGDWGGPLYEYCTDDGVVPTHAVQIGIVSYEPYGCSRGAGRVYTAVHSSAVEEWISDVVKE